MSGEPFFIDDKDRYGRLRLISWWDHERIARSRVLVVGAGALGNEVLKNLALLGIGHVVVVDSDTIEPSNLTRAPLFRDDDSGRPKAEVAASRVREMNPDVRTTVLQADVLHDIGLGVFQDSDLVFGCVDNREARLWINRQCWKTATPWIDAAIQELMGVVKVFTPPVGACYECAMTEPDYRLLNVRYACPLLRREDLVEGKIPTTPTAAAITAGLQTQEALKILHRREVRSGHAIVFQGETNAFHVTELPRKEDCLSHVRYEEVRELKLDTESTGEDLLRAAQAFPDGEILLERDLVLSVTCVKCNRSREPYRPRSAVSMHEGRCEICGETMMSDVVHRIAGRSPAAGEPLKRLGIPPDDFVRIRNGKRTTVFRLAGERRALPVRGEGGTNEL